MSKVGPGFSTQDQNLLPGHICSRWMVMETQICLLEDPNLSSLVCCNLIKIYTLILVQIEHLKKAFHLKCSCLTLVVSPFKMAPFPSSFQYVV